ncbi:PKHD-type hydroxylase [Tistlia consotensis]|uniref:PKHD-type hydroxylase n=1 Tax=Tistlia consotensis USBA 355 TaxID=560819 RepID=A0A1Y6B3F8_9PROT|nr:Fe2+-dependent dioxygenase [Tistlia consotensis]SME89488.1 PKHD-type hydroxylase [Tistlia consotensis USBA 355]SNR26024.1 PKHD-type hydroxylase [Tistlia consotensis]
MYLVLELLPPADCKILVEALGESARFEDGRRTAGWRARAAKRNEQAADDVTSRGIVRKIEQALAGNAVFRAAAQPKAVIRLLLSRYREGMAYGTHLDDAVIDGQRVDLSVTLFLSEPESYDGGELVIEGNDGERAFKLEPGRLVLYPTTELHRVEPVTRGERLAAVGWIRSRIRDPLRRELLFDLETALAELRRERPEGAGLDRLAKVQGNLLRLWVED